MPLLSNCQFNNPVGATLPAAPVAAAAPNLAPAQGDHVFGDVMGVLGTALQHIFGGGQNLNARMQGYNSTLATLWTGLAALDFGHGNNPPIVGRMGVAEQDQHAHMFGGYSARLQWALCEIVCVGFAPAESRRIGGFTTAWKTNVLQSFDELMNYLVDSRALASYLAAPNAIRNANNGEHHVPVSLAQAITIASNTAGPGRARIQAVLVPYTTLRNSLSGILDRFNTNTQTFVPNPAAGQPMWN